MANKNYGEVISMARKSMGVTQAQFAKAMRVSEPTQIKYESGKITPSMEYFERMVVYTGRSISSILGETPTFDTMGDVIDCIHVLNDMGVLKLKDIILEGKESSLFHPAIAKYLWDLDEATNGDVFCGSGAQDALVQMYRAIPAPAAGRSFEPSSTTGCRFASVRSMDVLFGYAGEAPIIVSTDEIDSKQTHNVLIPKKEHSEEFTRAFMDVKEYDILKETERFLKDMKRFFDYLPENDSSFSFFTCRAWEIKLPCTHNNTMIISAFDRTTQAPLTIILSTLIPLRIYEGAQEYQLPYYYVHRLPAPCNSEGRARQLAVRHAVNAPEMFGGKNNRLCEVCHEGDGGRGYELSQEFAEMETERQIFW